MTPCDKINDTLAQLQSRTNPRISTPLE